MSPSIKIRTFDPVPQGTYLLRIVDCKEKTTTDSKDGDVRSYYSWSLEVVNEDSDQIGRVVYFNTPTSFGIGSKGYRMLRAAGMEDVEGDAVIDTDDFLGLEFWADVIVVTGQFGKQKNDLKNVYTLDEYEMKHAKKSVVNKPKVQSVKPGVKPQISSSKSTKTIAPTNPSSSQQDSEEEDKFSFPD